MGKCHFRLGKYDQSINKFDEVLLLVPNNYDVLMLKVSRTFKNYSIIDLFWIYECDPNLLVCLINTNCWVKLIIRAFLNYEIIGI